MSSILLSPKDIYRVESDHIVYFSDITKGILQMLKFASEKSAIYQKDIMQAICDSKNITLYHRDLIVHCIEIDQYTSSSISTSLSISAHSTSFDSWCYIK